LRQPLKLSGTEQKDQTIRELRAQLMQSQKLAGLGALASSVAHEFNNILTAIMNYAVFALRSNDPEMMRKALDKIEGASERATTLTTGILGYAANRKPTTEPVNLTWLAEDTLTLIEHDLAKHRVRLRRDFSSGVLAVVDVNAMQQVLLNLLVNARQAMPEGGTLTLTIRSKQRPKCVEVAVTDTGMGIPRGKLKRIFEPFYTTRDTGTGLGLSVCREIVERHEGELRVASTEGKGTTMSILLPAATAQAAKPRRRRKSA